MLKRQTGTGTSQRHFYSASPAWSPKSASFYFDGINGRGVFNKIGFNSISSMIAAGKITFSRAASGLYLPTNGTYTSFASGAVRIGDKGLLIEPARTNQILSANNFNTTWIKNQCTVSAGTVSIGAFSLSTITRSGAVFAATTQTKTLVNGTTYRYSTYVKRKDGGTQWFGVYNNTAADWQSRVQVVWNGNGTMASFGIPGGVNFDAATALVAELIGNGVYRISYSAVYTGLNTDTLSIQIQVNRDADLTGNYAGAVQIEVASSTSSFIDTTTTAVTRDADVFTLFPAVGTYDITVTFDDDSTQVLAGQVITGSGWAIPTNLNRPYIKSIKGVVA